MMNIHVDRINRVCLIIIIIDNYYQDRLCLDLFGYASERSTCPIHHHMITYPSDTFPLKTCLNNKGNYKAKKLNGNSFHEHHHGTCQRHVKPKRMITPIVLESMY